MSTLQIELVVQVFIMLHTTVMLRYMTQPFLLFVVRFKSRSVTAENNPKKLRSNLKIVLLPNHNGRFFPLYFYEGKLIKWFRESLSYSGSYLTRPYCTKLLLFLFIIRCWHCWCFVERTSTRRIEKIGDQFTMLHSWVTFF